MLQAFIIVAREGLESFFLVAIIFAYLRKTGREQLKSTVYAGIGVSVLLSLGLGVLLQEVANQALWEAILASAAVLMVGSLVIHMWRFGPQLKKHMETRLENISQRPTFAAMTGVFLFTLLMITREGMETALMLFQVKQGNFILGAALGLAFAVFVSWLWTRASHLVNVKRFFQVTSVFLLVFLVQVAIYAFHEFCEAGVFAQSEHWHALSEPYSPDGMYGKWFSFIAVGGAALWLAAAVCVDFRKRKRIKIREAKETLIPEPQTK